jgi:hypothetical protein
VNPRISTILQVMDTQIDVDELPPQKMQAQTPASEP